jgi:hypothetical protein
MKWKRTRIRGLRRHFRNLRQRAKKPSEMGLGSLEWLTHFQQTYHKVIADPWANCNKVPQKPEFRALWVKRFLCTFPYWQTQLRRRYSDFYLAIWLYEPTAEDFCESRLMVAVNERTLFYKNYFGAAEDIPLPAEYLALPGIETLNWQAYPRLGSFSPEEFEAANWLANKPYKLGVTEQGESCIIVHFGWRWVGQAHRHQ